MNKIKSDQLLSLSQSSTTTYILIGKYMLAEVKDSYSDKKQIKFLLHHSVINAYPKESTEIIIPAIKIL